MRKKHRNLRRTAVGGVKQLYMILISIFMLFPLLWGLLTSLKPQDEIFTYPPKIFGSLTLENYQWVFEKQNLGMSILVTLGLAACSTVLGVLFATFAAYIFSRYSFTGKSDSAVQRVHQIRHGRQILGPCFVISAVCDAFCGYGIVKLPSFRTVYFGGSGHD